MGSILDDIPDQFKPKTKKEKGFMWIIKLLISLIGVVLTVGIFWGVAKTKIDYYEQSLESNSNSINSVRTLLNNSVEHLDDKIDCVNNRVDVVNGRVDDVNKRIDNFK